MKSPIIWVAALMLGYAALQAACADLPLTCSQALAQTSSADAKQRRIAVDRLGQVGLMSDARVLLKALHDRDDTTRALAEASIWRVWSRSGDAKIDELFERGMREMNIGALESALEIFTSVITIKKATVSDHGTPTGWSDTYGDGQAVFTGTNDITTGPTGAQGPVWRFYCPPSSGGDLIGGLLYISRVRPAGIAP